jgi:hypothetical protein
MGRPPPPTREVFKNPYPGNIVYSRILKEEEVYDGKIGNHQTIAGKYKMPYPGIYFKD